MTTEELRKELLTHATDGVLRVEAVVDAARDEASPLHTWFEWNESKAAHEYRLEQARRLIRRALVFVEFNGTEVPVRAFISLGNDRKADGGGYRTVVNVMADRDMRIDALAEAQADMERFEQKYKHLSELAEVLGAMGKARRRFASKVYSGEGVSQVAQA